MASFEAEKIRERKLVWGRIIFSSKSHITVITPQYTIIFHQFGAPANHYYTAWRLFRQELTRRKLESLYDVYKYANRYDITHFVKGSSLDRGSDTKIKLGEEQ